LRVSRHTFCQIHVEGAHSDKVTPQETQAAEANLLREVSLKRSAWTSTVRPTSRAQGSQEPWRISRAERKSLLASPHKGARYRSRENGIICTITGQPSYCLSRRITV